MSQWHWFGRLDTRKAQSETNVIEDLDFNPDVDTNKRHRQTETQ